MSRLVLDASVTMRWVLVDIVPPLAARVRLLLSESSWSAVVPALWHWEVANAVVAADRHNALVGAFDETWQRAEAWLRQVETDPHSDQAVAAAAELGRSHRLTVYDASYLELALRRRLPLATLDQQLRKAAAALGVVVDL